MRRCWLLTLLLLLVGTSSGASTVEVAWRYLDPARATGSAYASTTLGVDGSLYVAFAAGAAGGESILRKFDRPGNILWSASSVSEFPGFRVSEVVVDANDHAWVVGTIPGTGKYADLAWIRYDVDGKVASSRTWDGGKSVFSATAASDGRVYFAAETEEDAALLVACGADGEIVWTRSYPGAAGLEVVAGDDGAVTLIGLTGGSTPDGNILLVRYESDGDSVWARGYDGPESGEDRASAAVDARTGRVALAGYAQGSDGFRNPLFLVYDASGEKIVEYSWVGDPDAHDVLNDVAVDSAGTLYAAGGIRFGETADLLVARFEPEATTPTWQDTIDSSYPVSTSATGLAIDYLGRPYASGAMIVQEPSFDRSIFAIRFDPVTGARDWIFHEGVANDTLETGSAIHVDRGLAVTLTAQVAGIFGDTSGKRLTVKLVQDGMTPARVLHFDASPTETGAVLRWAVQESNWVEFAVDRLDGRESFRVWSGSARSGGPEYTIIDPAPPPGRECEYVLLARADGEMEAEIARKSIVLPVGAAVSTGPSPNPTTLGCAFRIPAFATASPSGAVFDVRGRRVKGLAASRHGDDWELRWDGLDADGRPTSRGLYFLVYGIGDRRGAHRVVRL